MPVTNFPTVSLDEPSYPALFYLSQGVAIIQVPSGPENNVFANAGSLAVDGTGNAWIKTTDYANTGWVSFGGGTGTLPGGLNKQVQFNDNLTAFGGASGFEYQAGSSPNVSITSQNIAHTAAHIIGITSQTSTVPIFRIDNSSSIGTSYPAFAVMPLGGTPNGGGRVFFGSTVGSSGFDFQTDWGSLVIRACTVLQGNNPELWALANTGIVRQTLNNSTINTNDAMLNLRHSSTGTVAANFGTEIRFGLESTTTDDQDAGAYGVSWQTATHASRQSQATLKLYNGLSGYHIAGYFRTINAFGDGLEITTKSGGLLRLRSNLSSGALFQSASNYAAIGANSNITFHNDNAISANPVLQIIGSKLGVNIGPTDTTPAAYMHIQSLSASVPALQANSAAGSSVAIAKFLDNTTDLYNFELSRLKIDKGTAFDVWLNTNAGAKSNFRVGATSGLHPGNAYGFILPYIGGSQSDGPGIYWTDGSYGATVRLNLNLGLNWQGCGGVTPFRIRKGTDNSSDGDVIFDFRPNDANFSLHPYGTGGGQTTPIIFRELVANGTNYVGFKSPDAITNDCVWVLPNADGKANQTLFTDGSKNLSWDSSRLPYAELYEDNGSTAITITTAGTYYQWQSSTVGSFANCSPNATNDNIVPDTDYGGTFQIAFSCSVTATANATIEAAIFVNGSRLPEGTVKRKVNASGDIDCLAIVCIATVAAGQTIDLRFTSDTNGDTITPIQCNLSVVRIGA